VRESTKRRTRSGGGRVRCRGLPRWRSAVARDQPGEGPSRRRAAQVGDHQSERSAVARRCPSGGPLRRGPSKRRIAETSGYPSGGTAEARDLLAKEPPKPGICRRRNRRSGEPCPCEGSRNCPGAGTPVNRENCPSEGTANGANPEVRRDFTRGVAAVSCPARGGPQVSSRAHDFGGGPARCSSPRPPRGPVSNRAGSKTPGGDPTRREASPWR
jgi:hypothetical protein